MTIDWWTLGFQSVNIAILIWLLQRFSWKPLSAMIAERRITAQKALTEAEATRDKAKADLVEIDKTRAGFAAEREKLLADAQAEAERSSAAKLAEADRQVATLVAAAKVGVEKDEAAAALAWASRSSSLAVDIARRLAARLDGPTVQAVFLDCAVKAVCAPPATTREAALASPRPLEATTPCPLDPAEQVHTIQSIGEAFGASVRSEFTTDPALIAGLELRTDHLVVANSRRADLAEILKGLAHDK